MREAGFDDAAAAIEEAEELIEDPQPSLIEVYDFVEVCCGPRSPLSHAMARQGLTVGPRIDLLPGTVWDITKDRVVSYLFYLIDNDRVWYVHDAVSRWRASLARGMRSTPGALIRTIPTPPLATRSSACRSRSPSPC